MPIYVAGETESVINQFMMSQYVVLKGSLLTSLTKGPGVIGKSGSCGYWRKYSTYKPRSLLPKAKPRRSLQNR